MTATVRTAQPEDVPAIVDLIRALAEFEKLPGPTDEAAARLRADAFTPGGRVRMLVSELEGEIVAYAIYFFTYSTFLARPTLFLEDVFVHPRARRQGVATSIMSRLREIAVSEGCGRFEWMVLDWNVDAQALYDGIGGRRLDEWRLYRMDLPPA